jgi:hypothetical protein
MRCFWDAATGCLPIKHLHRAAAAPQLLGHGSSQLRGCLRFIMYQPFQPSSDLKQAVCSPQIHVATRSLAVTEGIKAHKAYAAPVITHAALCMHTVAIRGHLA